MFPHSIWTLWIKLLWYWGCWDIKISTRDTVLQNIYIVPIAKVLKKVKTMPKLIDTWISGMNEVEESNISYEMPGAIKMFLFLLIGYKKIFGEFVNTLVPSAVGNYRMCTANRFGTRRERDRRPGSFARLYREEHATSASYIFLHPFHFFFMNSTYVWRIEFEPGVLRNLNRFIVWRKKGL